MLKSLKDEHQLAARVEERQDACESSQADTLQALTYNGTALKAAVAAVHRDSAARGVGALKRTIKDRTTRCRELISHKRFLQQQLKARLALCRACASVSVTPV